ncbi:kunitz trypsin inhibitor 2-like [Coffea eugenioides]|uniref:kunitz trypsin inhibitor 2-like n=1 Tax=Coffea eugenioides TaxID=49369 RepID=UPI000F60EEC9|nr:kunitz trypsin inhibitor 2-like [Coffea eugenioides]
MTTPILINLLISSFLLAFSVNFPLSTAQKFPAPVLDTAGQQLRSGVNYYILPAKGGNGGGVTFATGVDSRCPYEVAQASDKGNNGIPVMFAPFDGDSIIRVDTDSNIRFIDFRPPVTCPESHVWTLNSNRTFIQTGGVEGKTGPQTINNWFKIQTYEDAYQLKYCPGTEVCGNPCGILLLCENIGILVDNGKRALALNQPAPFKVVFTRA